MNPSYHTSTSQAPVVKQPANKDVFVTSPPSQQDFDTVSQSSQIFRDDTLETDKSQQKPLIDPKKHPIIAISVGWGLVVASHIFNSFEPVLGRLLLHDNNIPIFTLLFLMSVPFTVAMAPVKTIISIWKDRGALKQHAKAFFGHWSIYIFFVSTFLRSLSIICASKFTASVYVQMISLLAPFVVAFAERAFMKKKLIWQCFVALIFITLGGLIVVTSGDTAAGHSWSWLPNYSQFLNQFSFLDVLGMVLTFISNIMLATYMICIEKHPEEYSATTLLILHMMSISVFSLPIALIEIPQWHEFGNLSAGGWIAAIWLSISVHFLGYIFQAGAIQLVGATSTSAFLAFRLCCTIFFAWILLGEELSNLFQYLGIALIMISVTFFLGSKAWRERCEKKREGKNASDLIPEEIANQFTQDSETESEVSNPIDTRV